MDAARPHMESGDLAMFLVYIREAHPADGWEMATPDGEKTNQPTTLDERMRVARRFAAHHKDTLLASSPVLVDDPSTNALDLAYEAPPERLVVLDEAMTVVFASGQGPFQYVPSELKAFLNRSLL